MKIAVVGATGLVGGTILRVLEERRFPLEQLIPVASAQSVGRLIHFQGSPQPVIDIEDAITLKPDIAIFSAGSQTSLQYAPRFAEVGTFVIDNSSAWRMHADKKLIIPEINAHLLSPNDRIIANPNCSTIQMLVALYPLHRRYRIRRIVVATYQAVTGTGKKAVDQLMQERSGRQVQAPAYPHPIDLNALPHIDVFLDNGYTKEEMKMLNETRKILQDDSIAVSATTVRIPVMGGHSEAINVEFFEDFTLEEVRRLLAAAPGLVLEDEPTQNRYPMPIYAQNRDEVFVGRLRRDLCQPRTLNLWVVADNLRKGAATNAVQIAEYIYHNFIK